MSTFIIIPTAIIINKKIIMYRYIKQTEVTLKNQQRKLGSVVQSPQTP